MLVTVWRIENGEGMGPYQAYGCYKAAGWTASEHERCTHRPTPNRDGLPHPWDTQSRRYGFATLTDVNRWFTPTERQRLRARGFRLVCLQVPAADVLRGGKQVAFLDPRNNNRSAA